MTIDLDTFLTTVYVIIDDLYQQHYAHLKPKRPGKKPDLADSEVLTLTILAQWQQSRSERAFGEYAAEHWRSFFPRLLSQSQFNRRSRDLCGLLSALGPAIGRALTQTLGTPAYEVLDGVPVPLMRRCRGIQKRTFGLEAQFGRGGSDKEWYYGVKLVSVVNAHGLITGFVVGPANTEERWLAEALLRWRAFPEALPPRASDLEEVLPPRRDKRRGARKGPSGPVGLCSGVGEASAPVTLGDLGYAGEAWVEHWREDYGAVVLTQAEWDGQEQEGALDRQLHGRRQVVERVNGVLSDVVGLAYPRARTWWGVLTRLAAKIAASNMLLTLNHEFARPLFSHLSPFAL